MQIELSWIIVLVSLSFYNRAFDLLCMCVFCSLYMRTIEPQAAEFNWALVVTTVSRLSGLSRN